MKTALTTTDNAVRARLIAAAPDLLEALEAFVDYHGQQNPVGKCICGRCQSARAVIQHALDNPALAPFLAGGVGEYTDQELRAAEQDAWIKHGCGPNPDWLSAFLAALPRREAVNTILAGSRWVPAEELDAAIARAEKAEAELAAIKSSMPAAEPTPPVQAKPAAQVPLGPEDMKPGAVLKMPDWEEGAWRIVIETDKEGIWLAYVKTGAERVSYKNLFVTGAKINTSIPDTGRWDKDAWRPCSKPGKGVAK